jgi:transposase
MNTKHGSLSVQKINRLQGGGMILNGYDNDEIAEILEVSLSSVKNWRRILEDNDDDLDCLSRRKGTGRISKLTDKQKQKLKKIIPKEPSPPVIQRNAGLQKSLTMSYKKHLALP